MSHLYPRLGIYASSHGNGAPLLTDNWQIDPVFLDQMARQQLITLSPTPFADGHPEALNYLRSKNPNIIILNYMVAGGIWPYVNPGTFWGDMHTLVENNPMGYLKGIDGNIWYQDDNYNINIGNQSMSDQLSALWFARIKPPLWDGLFLDCYSSDIEWMSSPPNRPEDFVRAGYISLADQDQHRRATMQTFVANQRTNGHKIIIGNGTTPVSLIKQIYDGMLYEGWPALQGGLDQGIAMALDMDKPVKFVKVENYDTPYSQDWLKWQRYGLASACMCDAYFFFGPDASLNYQPYYHTWWGDEYSVTPYNPGHTDGRTDLTGAYVGWLGDKVNPCYKDITGCWIKKYPHGLVILNGTGQDQVVDLLAPYWRRIYGHYDPITNNGKTEQHVAVPQGDALFMISVHK